MVKFFVGYDQHFLEVYSLSHLFFQMRNAAAGKPVYPSVTLATDEFIRDVYEYAQGISCSVSDFLHGDSNLRTCNAGKALFIKLENNSIALRTFMHYVTIL